MAERRGGAHAGSGKGWVNFLYSSLGAHPGVDGRTTQAVLVRHYEEHTMGTRQIVINVPDKVLLATKSDEATFAREVAMLAAIKLYELSRLSSGRAAELAGIPRVEFLLALQRYKVFPLAAELDDLDRGHA
jgi:predicted HTH domain antitoxin